ncbi:MAG: FISUMP domain-containing protein, partial [Bacteroidota bacterium]
VENCEQYGRLYTYTASRNACPEGWRLPKVKDWKRLRKHLKSRKAHKIVVPGLWDHPGFDKADNTSGLSILPGGRKDKRGPQGEVDLFSQKGISSSYWLDHDEYHWHIRWGKNQIHKHGDISQQGRWFYIRCVCEEIP